jgi:hypothetical protein
VAYFAVSRGSFEAIKKFRAASLESTFFLHAVSSLGNNPILRYFDLVHTAKREEELHQISGRILRNLADNGANGIRNRSVENDRTHPQACQIHSNALTVT